MFELRWPRAATVENDMGKQSIASAGNRTRVTSMATMYSTTRPLMLMLKFAPRALPAASVRLFLRVCLQIIRFAVQDSLPPNSPRAKAGIAHGAGRQ